jgi:ferritin-like metal-binding protein YciE
VKKDTALNEELLKYLRDAHGMEKHSLMMLEAAIKVAGDPQLESLYRGHLKETEEHLRLIEDRLDAHDGSRSVVRDLAGRLTAMGLGTGVVGSSDAPAKLVAVAYGFENFEIASYELLRRVAQRSGDGGTVETAGTILVNERQAVEKLAASFDLALERSLSGPVEA